MYSNEKSIIIPPYGRMILLAVILIILGGGAYLEHFLNGTEIFYSARHVLGMGIILLVWECFHYGITEKGLSIRFLYIPLFLIRWEKISTAQYICSWRNGRSGSEEKGYGIFVTLGSSPAFLPEIDGLGMFLLKHPFRAFFIRFTAKKRVEYVKAFRKHYPDLLFQVGCDTQEFIGPDL